MTHPVDVDESVLCDGHVALVTGSSSGIGRDVARNLAECGATVLVHGRDRERTRETVEALPGEGHDWYLADFADLDAVREFAKTVRDDHDRLDCLVNNAGTWQGERRLVDVPGGDDLELTFVVNHLAPFLLTRELTERLAATAERRAEPFEPPSTAAAVDGSDGDGDSEATADVGSRVSTETANPARVVTVSSALHRRVEMDLDAVRGPDGPSGVDAYALSKLANVMFTAAFARRGPEGVSATCCHPGTAPATGLARDGSVLAGIGWRLFGLVGRVANVTDAPAEAAATPTYLACSPDVTGSGGKYYEDCEPTRSSAASVDCDAQRLLWEASERWTGIDGSSEQ